MTGRRRQWQDGTKAVSEPSPASVVKAAGLAVRAAEVSTAQALGPRAEGRLLSQDLADWHQENFVGTEKIT